MDIASLILYSVFIAFKYGKGYKRYFLAFKLYFDLIKDILLYDDLVTEDEEITIPHPELTKRLFVLEPLCELTPRGIHPLERRRYSDILEDLKEKEK